MKRTLIAALILTMAIAAIAAPPPRPGGGQSGPGSPQRGPGGPGGPGGEQLLSPEALAEFLVLTESQITQIQALREALEATVQPLMEQQRANQQAVEAALAAGDANAAGAAMLAGYNLRTQIKAAHDSFKASFESVLTTEQKSKWSVYQEIVELSRPPRD